MGLGVSMILCIICFEDNFYSSKALLDITSSRTIKSLLTNLTPLCIFDTFPQILYLNIKPSILTLNTNKLYLWKLLSDKKRKT